MMRTTVRLDDQLAAETKKLAVETQRSVTRVIEDALREVLGRRQRKGSRRKVRLTTFKGKGLQPGVDLDRTASLIDLTEKHGAAD